MVTPLAADILTVLVRNILDSNWQFSTVYYNHWLRWYGQRHINGCPLL